MRVLASLALILLSSVAQAEPPWGQVDLKAGEALHAKDCTACHIRMYGGDGSTMYTRAGRMLSNRLEVLQRVASCNATMSTGWFPDDEAHVAAWLNSVYYQFKD
jgi:cytochrome c553